MTKSPKSHWRRLEGGRLVWVNRGGPTPPAAPSAPDMDFDPDAQLAWEYAVHEEFRRRGYDPIEIETEVEGFGQDYAEFADDPVAFVDAVIGEEQQGETFEKSLWRATAPDPEPSFGIPRNSWD